VFREKGYKWISVPCINYVADYICTLRSPKCPDGYTWLAQFGAACFKVTPSGPFEKDGVNYNAVWTSEAMCAAEGTRLAVFKTAEQGHALKNWLSDREPWLSGDKALIHFYLG